ncbi:MAG: murein biosynthesis integral membrane protein MurJ [Phycisphaeraceae bacterium]|nr:murein biosynthesis integral membrane protein MurJ [Phycisphaeraceae bacterium]
MSGPTEPEPAGEPDDGADGGFIGHALKVSSWTLFSRLTGLGRDAALAAVFGLGAVADAFFIGFLVPNLSRRLFGEGAFAAAFIPEYADLVKNDRQLARRLATLCLVALTVVLGGLTLIGEAVLLGMQTWGVWSPESSLAIRLTMVMLPYMPLVCLVALLGGILQVHGKFGPPAAAPVILNLVMIGAALAVMPWAPASAAMAVAAAVVGAGVLQLAWLGVTTLGVERPGRALAGTGPALRRLATAWLPMMAGLAVFQINALLDHLIAFGLAPRTGGPEQLHLWGRIVDYPVQAGAVAALQWAQRLYQFPLGVFGIALATAIFPALASAAAGSQPEDERAYAATLRRGVRLAVFIGLPAGVGLWLVGYPLVRLIYARGAFSLDDVDRVATILSGYAVGVWAYSATHVVTRAFYARRDTITPLLVGVVIVILNLGLNLVLIWPLGAAGLAWSTAITASLQTVILLLLISRKAAHVLTRPVVIGCLRSVALTAVMAAAVASLAWALNPVAAGPWVSAAMLFGLVITGMMVYGAGAWWTGAPEWHWLLKRPAER